MHCELCGGEASVFVLVDGKNRCFDVFECKRRRGKVCCEKCLGTGSNCAVYPIEGCSACGGSGLVRDRETCPHPPAEQYRDHDGEWWCGLCDPPTDERRSTKASSTVEAVRAGEPGAVAALVNEVRGARPSEATKGQNDEQENQTDNEAEAQTEAQRRRGPGAVPEFPDVPGVSNVRVSARTNDPKEASEKCGSLCVSCKALPESASPSECICHWCLLRSYQRQYEVFDQAMAAISRLGGEAEALAVKARNDARGFECFKVERGTGQATHPVAADVRIRSLSLQLTQALDALESDDAEVRHHVLRIHGRGSMARGTDYPTNVEPPLPRPHAAPPSPTAIQVEAEKVRSSMLEVFKWKRVVEAATAVRAAWLDDTKTTMNKEMAALGEALDACARTEAAKERGSQ